MWSETYDLTLYDRPNIYIIMVHCNKCAICAIVSFDNYEQSEHSKVELGQMESEKMERTV